MHPVCSKKASKIKAVIFDFGGVFASNTFPFIVKDLANSFNASAFDVEKWFKDSIVKEYEKGNISDNAFWSRISELAGKPLPDNYKDLLIREYKNHSRIKENMEELVNYLKKRGYKTAVLSNTVPPHMNYNLKNGRYSIFDVIILSPQVHHAKPEREIYKEALRRLNVKPEEAVFTDDKLEYVNAAKEVGIHAILFQNYLQFLTELKRLLQLKFEDLNSKDSV